MRPGEAPAGARVGRPRSRGHEGGEADGPLPVATAGYGVPGTGPDAGEGACSRYEVRSEEDLLTVRHEVRAATVRAGFGIVDQTRIVTAASELARNAYVHGGGGTLEVRLLAPGGRRGLRLTVRDEGPGIPDVEAALQDGFTTGSGLGHGLGGARRLMHDFQVRTAPGRGTTVVVTRWNDR
ncbi:anti-sigma regulatory factor [Streptomyces somaliensis]|uniref:Anti-sigma regulatory factor n=1 Tax=Streptomyces somaliensis (strain ATCC 33201 / DSM 40738 / JCM 12659 / KCTC 9044 / NCTC 11332 / NRRL B-12077 / IP 733) TaxID=1134445 RepID=A0AA44IFM2_STRE0|nr:anti-sigma regulatory factor [Streptomyces somaliensis]NKY16613.1 anti-sigma regulatory factor [Streptomyces somaliensis DSM 40738]